MLPLVGHGIERDLEMQLAEAYGVLLGKALSNRMIDTMVMAADVVSRARSADSVEEMCMAFDDEALLKPAQEYYEEKNSGD